MMTNHDLHEDSPVQEKVDRSNGMASNKESGDSSASTSSLTDDSSPRPSTPSKMAKSHNLKGQPKKTKLPRKTSAPIELTEAFGRLSLDGKLPKEKTKVSSITKEKERIRSFSGNDIPVSKETSNSKVRRSSGVTDSKKLPVLEVAGVMGRTNDRSVELDSNQNRLGINHRYGIIAGNARAAVNTVQIPPGRASLFATNVPQASPAAAFTQQELFSKHVIEFTVGGRTTKIADNNILHKFAYEDNISGFETAVTYFRYNGMSSKLNEVNELDQTPLFIFAMLGRINGLKAAMTFRANLSIPGRTLRLRSERERRERKPDELFAATLKRSPLSVITMAANVQLLRQFLAKSSTCEPNLDLDQCDESGEHIDSGLPPLAKIIVSERRELLPNLEVLVQAGAKPFAKFSTKAFPNGTPMALALMVPSRMCFAKAMIDALRNTRAQELMNLNNLVAVTFNNKTYKEGLHLDVAYYGLQIHEYIDDKTRLEADSLISDLVHKLHAKTTFQHATSHFDSGYSDSLSPNYSLSSVGSSEASPFSPASGYGGTAPTPQTAPMGMTPSPPNSSINGSFYGATASPPDSEVYQAGTSTGSYSGSPPLLPTAQPLPVMSQDGHSQICMIDFETPEVDELRRVALENSINNAADNAIALEDQEYGQALLDKNCEEILCETPAVTRTSEK